METRALIGKFLLRICVFLVFSSTIYSILICVAGEILPKYLKRNILYTLGSVGFTHTRLEEAKITENIDILFLGSSHAYRGFDNRIFQKHGYSSFNLGTSSQTPLQTHTLLKRYVKKIKPKIIILEVSPMSFEADGVESSIDILSNDLKDLNSITMVLNQNHIKAYNTLIYSIYRDLIDINKDFAEPPNKGGDFYISGGFVENKCNKVILDTTQSIAKTINYSKTQLKCFEAIINEVRELNMRLILIQAPITSLKYATYLDNTSFDEKMMKYGEYFNFNTLMSLTDSIYFYDSHHLNQLGVDKFNTEVIIRL